MPPSHPSTWVWATPQSIRLTRTSPNIRSGPYHGWRSVWSFAVFVFHDLHLVCDCAHVYKHCIFKVSCPSPKWRSPNPHQARAAREVVIWRPSSEGVGMKVFSHSFRPWSKPYFGWRPLVVVINGLVFHCLEWSTRDRFALCSRSKKKRPLLGTCHMHAGPPYKRRKQELTRRSGKVELRHAKPRNLFAFCRHTCMHFRLFTAIEKGLLQKFWMERRGHSQRLWALEAFYQSSHLKCVWILSSFDLLLARACAMDNEQKRKGQSKDRFWPTNQYRIRSKNQKLSSSSPIFFSQSLSLSLIAFLVLDGGWEGRPFVVCEGKTQTHRHTDTDTQKKKKKKKKPVVISVCIRLMLGGGDWKACLFKREIQHLLKSMGFDAGSRLGGVDEKSPPLISNQTRWVHQRCWAENHDPPGMPNFYGWRHGVGRRMQISKCELVHVVRGYSPKHFLKLPYA